MTTTTTWPPLRYTLTLILTLAVIAVACSGEAAHPSDVCELVSAYAQTGQIQLPPDGPPSFPYIFQGGFTIDGESGPAGLTMYARIGRAKSPLIDTGTGAYRNIIIGPLSEEDLDAEVEFYLGTPEQSGVKADQVFRFERVSGPKTFECELSFPRLP